MRVLHWLTVLVIVIIVLGAWFFLFYKKNSLPLFPVKVVQVVAPMRYITEQEVQDLLVKAKIESAGFFFINMRKIKQELQHNQWVDDISINRIWPDKIRINFKEELPLAYWNNTGIITRRKCEVIELNEAVNTRIKQEMGKSLPILVGNEIKSKKLCDTLAKFEISVKPIYIGIKKLVISERNSWYLELNNGLLVLLGKKDILSRLNAFVKFYSKLHGKQLNIVSKDGDMNIAYVDMRYHNGLAVGRERKNNLTEIMETA